MSQNSHGLLLFFDSEARSKSFLHMLLALDRGEADTARQWSQRLNVDLSGEWNDEWFNHSVKAQPEFIRLDYDSGNGHVLPLRALKQLFGHGLRAAVLETFIDQAGEVHRHHFLDGLWVNPEALYEALPGLRAIVEAQLPIATDQPDPSRKTRQPVSLQKLIDQEGQHAAEAKEVLGLLTGAHIAARKSGQSTLAVVKAALVVRAMIKGVLQALAFMAVTLLLFKGKWLWIGLGLVLLIALPLLYAGGVAKDFAEPKEAGDAAAN